MRLINHGMMINKVARTTKNTRYTISSTFISWLMTISKHKKKMTIAVCWKDLDSICFPNKEMGYLHKKFKSVTTNSGINRVLYHITTKKINKLKPLRSLQILPQVSNFSFCSSQPLLGYRFSFIGCLNTQFQILLIKTGFQTLNMCPCLEFWISCFQNITAITEKKKS